MSNEIVMKKGDNLPIRELQLQQTSSSREREPIDLSDAFVEFYVYDIREKDLIINGGECSVTTAGEGLIEYEWQDNDTKTTGVHKGEFVVIYADGEITVPNDGFIPVRITQDLQDNYGGE